MSVMMLSAARNDVGCREPIPKPLPAEYGPNDAGYIAIFVLTASLVSSTMFSEAVWQRVWASADRRALYGGAAAGLLRHHRAGVPVRLWRLAGVCDGAGNLWGDKPQRLPDAGVPVSGRNELIQ